MRINSLTIKNFRCYYGENKISFNSDGKITLIYGDSGYGKSSFLQFFNWMFYDKPNFGDKDDKPLYNISAFKEKKLNDILEVSGIIDFEHLGIKYNLIKKLDFKIGLKEKSTLVVGRDLRLSVLNNDNWEPYKGDIANKINNIMPIGLSSYFLLDGEKARDIVLDAKNLKKAIYSLFEIDAYEKAIKHLGSSHQKKSVIGYFNGLMTSQMTVTSNNMSAAEMQEHLEDLFDEIEGMKEERRDIIAKIDAFNARREEIFKTLGETNNKSNLNQIIKQDKQFISDYQVKIRGYKRKIGELFYKNYPSLILSNVTSNSSTILRRKNADIASNYKNVFENLKKDLLKEVIDKNICICGRELDEKSINHINSIINVMPPDSYAYQFGQFVSKSKKQIQVAKTSVLDYDKYLSCISQYEQKISICEDDIHEKEETLKRLDAAKTLVDELENIKIELEGLNRRKSGLEGTIAQKKQVYELASKKLKDLQKNDKVAKEYGSKIDFFQRAHDILVEAKDSMEIRVKEVLNRCVRDVFKKLSTQKDLDPDTIQFINDDFSLRTTYLSGGQLAVDEYSYVIGLIKALQECQAGNNENPIIVDAPFAFTGNAQSEHIFKTIPTIAKQTIFLTLDLNKIKNLLSDQSLYEFYVIKNETQSKARIERGHINDIKL